MWLVKKAANAASKAYQISANALKKDDISASLI